jgi:hypothetical protein
VKSGGLSVRKVGECDVASQHLQGFSHCLCRLRTDGLTPTSKYWTYRSYAGDICPISLVAHCQEVLGLSTLVQWLCWRRNLGGSHRPLSWAERWSREQCIHPTLLMTRERLLYVDYIRYVWSRTIRGPSMKSVWRVDWVFPCMVYINSNRRDSRIWVIIYLWQSSRS